MDDRLHTWHLGDEAVYDYVDRALSPAAMAEAERHVRSCPGCSRRVLHARLLFARLRIVDSPRLDRDLSPGVMAAVRSTRTSSVRWRWVLAAQAIASMVALAALGLQLDRWANVLLSDPTYQALRQAGARLVAQASGWLAPFLDFIPAFPARLAPIHIALPHLDGPVQGWVGLAVAALVLGLVGNALLLRSTNGAIPSVSGSGRGKPTACTRFDRNPGGRRT